MPLSKEKNKERMRLLRHPVQPVVQPIQGLKMEGNRIVGLDRPVKPMVVLPFCEWCQVNHEYGEHVKPPPKIDADGHTIPDY